jgi:hypothetical protein
MRVYKSACSEGYARQHTGMVTGKLGGIERKEKDSLVTRCC